MQKHEKMVLIHSKAREECHDTSIANMEMQLTRLKIMILKKTYAKRRLAKQACVEREQCWGVLIQS